MALDAALLSLAFVTAFLVRFDGAVPDRMWQVCYRAVPIVVALKLIIYSRTALYKSIWRYTGSKDLQRLATAQAAGLATTLLVVTMIREATDGFPRGVYLIDTLLAFSLTGAARFAPRWLRETLPSSWVRPLMRMAPARVWPRPPGAQAKRLLIVGADDGAEMLVSQIAKNPQAGYVPVGLAAYDPLRRNQSIHGVPVLGLTDEVGGLVGRHRIDEIIITLPPGSGGDQVRTIVDACGGLNVRLRILPAATEVLAGPPGLADIRELKLEDLLRRDEVTIDLELVSGYLRGARVLVTGAGGSIGSELCRQIAAFGPAELVLLGRGENSIFCIDQELASSCPSILRRQVIGDVINKRKLDGVFSCYRPEIVFHAGADKHVPLMEGNPDEAVLNNVLGTRNVLEVCEAFGAQRLVCVSTDKVVNPTSVMGCCKHVAEMLLHSRRWRTPSMAVRFGNVLGSRGSVVPTFYEQIRRGGPVTITHPEMTRYFMTIPEAARLVVQAGALGRGGEVFLLDMGEQLRIADVARDMIRLAGHGADIPIQFVGMRPGEKLYEELAERGEELRATSHPKILRVAGNNKIPDGFEAAVRALQMAALEMDRERIISILAQIVPTYEPGPWPLADAEVGRAVA